MKLKLFLVAIIFFVLASILLLTGKIMSLVVVLKSFLLFVLNFVIGIILIAAVGHGLLFAWGKISKIFRKKKRVRKVYVKKVTIPKTT